MKAADLGIGTSIVTRAGPVTLTAKEEKKQSATVYNLEVSDYHTYFVGESRVWVHNGCGPNRPVNPTKQQVEWETKIPSSSYPGKSRQLHNQEANKNLIDAADKNPDMHKYLDDSYPGWRQSIETPNGVNRQSPQGLSWHHGDNPGQMQLVPRDLHNHFHGLYHPSGSGGFKIWG